MYIFNSSEYFTSVSRGKVVVQSLYINKQLNRSILMSLVISLDI